MRQTRKVITINRQTNQVNIYSCLGLFCKHIGISRRTAEKWFLNNIRRVELDNLVIIRADQYYDMSKKK